MRKPGSTEEETKLDLLSKAIYLLEEQILSGTATRPQIQSWFASRRDYADTLLRFQNQGTDSVNQAKLLYEKIIFDKAVNGSEGSILAALTTLLNEEIPAMSSKLGPARKKRMQNIILILLSFIGNPE